jgi:hypothetical protein
MVTVRAPIVISPLIWKAITYKCPTSDSATALSAALISWHMVVSPGIGGVLVVGSPRRAWYSQRCIH